MSKILEITACNECSHFGGTYLRPGCELSEEVFTHDSDISPNCPLKDSNYWKKELLKWIEEEKFDCREDNWIVDIVVLVEDLKQKIQEM